MNKILVPTDFSEEASNALDAAVLIANKCGGEINLLHIVDANFEASLNMDGDLNPLGDMDQAFVMKMIEMAKGNLKEVTDSPKYSDTKINSDIKVGNPFENIFRKINEIEADLVVMGTSGASGLAEILVGSNTEKVVRMAKCPVLTLKGAIDDSVFNDIVFATDLSEKQEAIVAELKQFQDEFGSSIHLVRINTPNNFQADRITREQMKRFAEKHGFEKITFNIYNDVIEEDGIMHFAHDINAGLIAMATNGRRGLSHLFSGSITEDVVNHANRPVLTFNMRG